MANKILPSIAPKPTVFPPTTGCDSCENLTARIEQAEDDIEELQETVGTPSDSPVADEIAKYDPNEYLHSTTPSLLDSSDKVATTEYVTNSIENLFCVKDIRLSENELVEPTSILDFDQVTGDYLPTFTFKKTPVLFYQLSASTVVHRNSSFILEPFNIFVLSVQLTLGRDQYAQANVPFPVGYFELEGLHTTRAVSATRNVYSGTGSIFTGMISSNNTLSIPNPVLYASANVAMTQSNEYTIDFDQIIFLDGTFETRRLTITCVDEDGETLDTLALDIPTGESYFVNAPEISGYVPISQSPISGVMPDTPVFVTVTYMENPR